MKKRINILPVFIASMAVLGLSGCAREELSMPDTVEEGVPITVTLNLSGTSTSDIVVDTKASGSNYSTLYDLVIFIYHGDGTFESVVTNYNGSTSLEVGTPSTSSDNHRIYEVKFGTTSGTKKLLAVANIAEGGYWGKIETLLRQAYDGKWSFDQLKSNIVSLRDDITDGVQPFHITASSQMFISGWNEGVVFGTNNSVTNYGTYGDPVKEVAIKMYRAMANITFNIAASPNNRQGTFTPTSYRVYNIPTRSYLINDVQGKESYSLTEGIGDVTYIHTASENIGTAQDGNYTFDFYMPENVQNAGTNISDYNDRDKWEGEQGSTADKKIWLHAPQNSTFVVISGTYEGKATVDEQPDQNVTANVEYTIHLGDFGKSIDQNRDYADFSVMRNYSYTYNVQVLGVDNIIVEAISDGPDENQSGAEGSVYDRENTQFSYNLDAHYEQVYLEYNLSDIANSLGNGLTDADLDNAIANQLILIIQSPMMSYTHDEKPGEPYTTRNNRGTLSPYKIYADAVREADDATAAAAAAKSNVLGGDGEGAAPTKGFDYKWIEFFPQEDKNTISEYPGISSWAMESLDGLNNQNFYAGATGNDDMLDVYDVIVEMGKAIKQIYNKETLSSDKIKISTDDNNNYVARFTAFVNEYYYLRHPLTGAKATSWSRMTNKIPREMIIAMSTETSTDGNSSYSKIHSYITQLAMQTFYNDESASLNAFGIETYNETPLTFKFGTPESKDGLTDNYGRENQKILIGASSWYSPYWSSFIAPEKNGWTQSVGSEHDKHKLNEAYAKESAYSACMSRNRDLNGNGRIDENEIRWFLASVNEYIRMGIGATAISNSAQLFIGDKTTMVKGTSATSSNGYPSAYIEDGSLFYTSSEDAKRVYWAIEKGSYGAIDSYYDGSALPIRCIRNLPASAGTITDISSINGVNSDATYVKHDASGNTPIVLEFKDRLVQSLYRQRVQGSLDIHNEDDDANKFYEGIFVASDYIHTTDWWGNKTYQQYYLGNIIGYTGSQGGHTYNGIMSNPCSSYTEGGYGNWRVPNLVELSALNAAGLLNRNTACCTQFSNLSVRYGFVFQDIVTCPGNDAGDINNQYYIRCVRDVPAGYAFPTN